MAVPSKSGTVTVRLLTTRQQVEEADERMTAAAEAAVDAGRERPLTWADRVRRPPPPEKVNSPEYVHVRSIITRQMAADMERTMNIRGLARVLMSAESEQRQRDGFEFVRVYRGESMAADDGSEVPPEPLPAVGDDSVLVPIQNKWGDQVHYIRRHRTRPRVETSSTPKE